MTEIVLLDCVTRDVEVGTVRVHEAVWVCKLMVLRIATRCQHR